MLRPSWACRLVMLLSAEDLQTAQASSGFQSFGLFNVFVSRRSSWRTLPRLGLKTDSPATLTCNGTKEAVLWRFTRWGTACTRDAHYKLPTQVGVLAKRFSFGNIVQHGPANWTWSLYMVLTVLICVLTIFPCCCSRPRVELIHLLHLCLIHYMHLYIYTYT